MPTFPRRCLRWFVLTADLAFIFFAQDVEVERPQPGAVLSPRARRPGWKQGKVSVCVQELRAADVLALVEDTLSTASCSGPRRWCPGGSLVSWWLSILEVWWFCCVVSSLGGCSGRKASPLELHGFSPGSSQMVLSSALLVTTIHHQVYVYVLSPPPRLAFM